MSYLEKVLQMHAQNPVQGVSFLTIAHDDWCPALTGGECQCDPEVSRVSEGQWIAAETQNRQQRRAAAKAAQAALRKAAGGKR